MQPILIPLLEHSVRRALKHGGFVSSLYPAPLGRVHVFDGAGQGPLPTTVFLHGLSSSATQFAPLLSGLRKRSRRVVALDYPGHGFSDAPTATLTPERLFETTTAALDHVLGDDRVVLVGNSLGGAVAIDYAIKRPQSVRALVLLSPAGADSAEHEWQELKDAFAITSRAGALAFMDRVHHRSPFIMKLLAHEVPASMNRRAVRDLFDNMSPRQGVAAAELGALSMPILFWWGRSERLLPSSHLAWWKKNLPPHAVVEEPEGMGHCPHLDSPSRVTERIASFLASLES